jgi:hypothetical protein
MFLVMWILKSYTAKVLVWLAAALLPGDMLLAGACGCGERNGSDAQGKSAKASQVAACCCHSGAVCQCCHRAKNVKQSACCKNRTNNSNTSRGGLSPVCVCSSGRVPAPQIPISDSSVAKQLAGHAWASLAPTAVVTVHAPALNITGDLFVLPVTSLDRLSNLCRLII